MKRTLIKQGTAGLTFYVPKKWADKKGLKPGDEVEVTLEEETLTIHAGAAKKEPKRTEVKITPENYNVYRSLIGGLYRAGYDEIKITFDDRKVITELQKTVDSLYGLEIFDIDDKSCIIKCVYTEEAVELFSHLNKIIHIIKTMQAIIIEDIEHKTYNSRDELYQFRNNILKQRDIIARTIVQQKLTENKEFPSYILSFFLWNIARNYFNLYEAIQKSYRITKQDITALKKTNDFFVDFFKDWNNHPLTKKHANYRSLIADHIQGMKTKDASIVLSYCMNISMLIQSCGSHLLVLNY